MGAEKLLDAVFRVAPIGLSSLSGAKRLSAIEEHVLVVQQLVIAFDALNGPQCGETHSYMHNFEVQVDSWLGKCKESSFINAAATMSSTLQRWSDTGSVMVL